MKRNRIAAWVLLLVMLCTSCHTGDISSGSTSAVEEGDRAEYQFQWPARRPQETNGSREPEKLNWTTEPVLEKDEMPGNYNGLELPVIGATGYTSVELPLWERVEDSEAARRAVEEWEIRQEEKRLQEEQARLEAENGAGDSSDSSAELPPDGNALAEPLSDEMEPEPTPEPEPEPELPIRPEPEPELPSQPEPEPEQPVSSLEPIPPEEPETTEEPPTLTDGALALLKPGAAFVILQESNSWWKVQCETDYMEGEQKKHGVLIGWVEHRYCMINLPDVIPSMVYDDTNAYASAFISCGMPIDGITGETLYQGALAYNPRLEEQEFMMPVLYSMAYRLCAAQRAALEQGNTLVLYEGYRPYFVQTMVSKALSAMMQKYPAMRQEVAGEPWSISWFIATGISNHQQGYAVDVSLARVSSVRTGSAGKYPYIRVEEYELYEMPTPIHELSRAAATYTAPVNSMSSTAWKSAELSESMNAPALGMQGYCTGAGLTPLASEWWHFNDLYAYSLAQDKLGTGGFVVNTCLSIAPGG